ncbi:MAG: WecB/TagA/CpsF family glycosyltransferase [Peptococcaceae bacterium]|nr:WecB/TagA/CpsF family glycosyltransferase [Peptococcaceae bacterium]
MLGLPIGCNNEIHAANILGVQVHVATMEQSLDRVDEALQQGRCLRVITANPEMIVRAEKEEGLREIIRQADLVVPDGEGVVWAARFLGWDMTERVTGVDLTQRFLEKAHTYGWRVFFLGGKPGVADEAARKVREDFAGLEVEAHHGFFGHCTQEDREDHDNEEGIVARIREFNPHILLAGMGVPYQEYWLSRYPDLARVSMGVGGTFDVLSGQVKRAPQWVRRVRLEWFYRVLQDPRRVKRQLRLAVYVMKVIGQRIKG